jgi:hypothetical protein
MTNYDAITNQFAPALSDLARRMYAAIYEATSKQDAKIYMLAGEINDALDTDITCIGGPGEDALLSLIKANLISFNPGEWFRYYLSCAAWRAHLLAERAEREKGESDGIREHA